MDGEKVKKKARKDMLQKAIDTGNKKFLPEWHNDNIEENGKTSIEILFDWLTVEQNGTKYLGAKDSRSQQTDGKTKTACHKEISDMIKNELGEFFMF